MGYGENIRAARKAAGLTQEQLAQKCKLATITIRQYELEKREPSFAQLKIIASALDVTVPFLQGYESMDARKMLEALKSSDFKELERITGLPEGSIMPLSDDEREYVESQIRDRSIRVRPPEHGRDETGLNAVRSLGQSLNQLADMTVEAFGLDLDILLTRCHILNAEGKREARKRMLELARLPEYTVRDEEKTPPEATGAATEDE